MDVTQVFFFEKCSEFLVKRELLVTKDHRALLLKQLFGCRLDICFIDLFVCLAGVLFILVRNEVDQQFKLLRLRVELFQVNKSWRLRQRILIIFLNSRRHFLVVNLGWLDLVEEIARVNVS